MKSPAKPPLPSPIVAAILRAMADRARPVKANDLAAVTELSRKNIATRLSQNKGVWVQQVAGRRGYWEPTEQARGWMRVMDTTAEDVKLADMPTSSGATTMDPGAEYTPAQMEFIVAVQAFQVEHKRRFLAHTDYLKIALKLGYRRENKCETK